MWNKSIITLCDESKLNLLSSLGQWKLKDNKYIKLGNGYYPVIYTHSIIENREYGENTHDPLINHFGELYSKHMQSPVLNTALAPESVELE